MSWEVDLATLVLRVVVGIAFVFHGYPKLVGVSRKQSLEFMKSVGVPPAATTLVGLLELIGGLFLVVGVLTRLTAGLLALEMLGTTLLSRRMKKKYMLGYELDLAYLAASLALALLGAGVYSLDSLFGIRALPFVA